jgi:hypothetical protein
MFFSPCPPLPLFGGTVIFAPHFEHSLPDAVSKKVAFPHMGQTLPAMFYLLCSIQLRYRPCCVAHFFREAFWRDHLHPSALAAQEHFDPVAVHLGFINLFLSLYISSPSPICSTFMLIRVVSFENLMLMPLTFPPIY